MTVIAVLIFLLTYAGVAVGDVPGLKLDRTGIAFLGAIAMAVAGIVPLDQLGAAVDLPTLLLLYALMVVSAQLQLSGFYTWIALRITTLVQRPRLFLWIMMLTSAVLSALLANDIICLAFTPVLTVALLSAQMNPLPFLLGLALSSNIGSAATIIGNPQNMLIGQAGRLHFGQFLLWCAPPALLALAVGYVLLAWLYRGRFTQQGANAAALPHDWPDFNRWQSTKGLLLTTVLIALFFTPIPRELSAMTVAGILLCSRYTHSRSMLELVDWHLITLFCGLFVVIHGIAAVNVPVYLIDLLERYGIALDNLYILTGASTVLSNLVSNVPATMLLIQFLDRANPVPWYALAVSSTFAGNLIVIGSIANLIVIEQAKRYGVEISFGEHARTGIPVTLLSLVVLIGWIYVS
ncbi:MAG: anion transporter [Rhodospirillales bacterium]|nr:anion transporter [Rhodospirillales bacterium]